MPDFKLGTAGGPVIASVGVEVDVRIAAQLTEDRHCPDLRRTELIVPTRFADVDTEEAFHLGRGRASQVEKVASNGPKSPWTGTRVGQLEVQRISSVVSGIGVGSK